MSKSKCLVSTPVLDIRYKHFKSQNNNLFNLFNDKFYYALANYFVKSETI